MTVGQGIGNKGLVSIAVLFKSGRYPISGSTVFYIDTGSPKSFLNSGELQRIGQRVSLSSLNFSDTAFLAGGRSKFADIGKCIIMLRAKDEIKRFSIERFWVAQEMRQNVGETPSILGTDFLTQYKIKVCFDENPPYLEIP